MKLLTELLSARRGDETQKDFEQRRFVGQVFQMALLTGARVVKILLCFVAAPRGKQFG